MQAELEGWKMIFYRSRNQNQTKVSAYLHKLDKKNQF